MSNHLSTIESEEFQDVSFTEARDTANAGYTSDLLPEKNTTNGDKRVHPCADEIKRGLRPGNISEKDIASILSQINNIMVENRSTDIYVLSVDDKPIEYTTNIDIARTSMRKTAHTLMNNYHGYNMAIAEFVDPDKINVIGHDINLLVAYDTVLYRLKIHTVPLLTHKED